MNPQEQQLIESLFQRLQQSAAQAGPRDPEAEALIQQRAESFPGVMYYLAQTLLVQERALQQAEARLNAQSGQSSFLPPAAPAPGGYQYGTPQPRYAPQPQFGYQPAGGGAGGFLASAGKVALGVGGGILVADAAMGLARDVFGGGGGFGGGGLGPGYDQGYQQGMERGEQVEDQGSGQHAYQQDDWTQQQDPGYDQQDSYDSGGLDSGGGFDSGGSDDSGAGW